MREIFHVRPGHLKSFDVLNVLIFIFAIDIDSRVLSFKNTLIYFPCHIKKKKKSSKRHLKTKKFILRNLKKQNKQWISSSYQFGPSSIKVTPVSALGVFNFSLSGNMKTTFLSLQKKKKKNLIRLFSLFPFLFFFKTNFFFNVY